MPISKRLRDVMIVAGGVVCTSLSALPVFAQDVGHSVESAVVDSNPFHFHDLNQDEGQDEGQEGNTNPSEILSGGLTGEAALAPNLEALKYAADSGDGVAMWRLGRHYARGARTSNDHMQAFDMFSRVVRAEGDLSPYSPRAPYVANSLSSLGLYYLQGIPDSPIEKNRQAAWRMFYTAGNLFGDPSALFSLSEMCDGEGDFHCTPRQGVKWLKLAATNGHVGAQARLGHKLFEGDGVGRSPVNGLMWLTIARERANAVRDAWVSDLHEAASSVATVDERRLALSRAEAWMQDHCSNTSRC